MAFAYNATSLGAIYSDIEYLNDTSVILYLNASSN